MMRSLYSGVSGLRVHQTKMDVIGNNIANVNTVGFKSSSVTFSDIFYQTTQAASGSNESTGTAGRNAMQIGLGSTVAAITSSISTTGGSQRTDNALDVMINGDSFFVVNSGGTNYFTKAGSFGVDSDGYLCTSTGAYVMGWQVNANDSSKTVAATVTPLQVMSASNKYSAPEATTKVTVSGNIDSTDTEMAYTASGKTVNVEFYDSIGRKYTAELKVKQAAEDNTSQFTVTVSDIKDSDGNSIFYTKTTTGGTTTYTATSVKSFSFAGINYTASVGTSGLTLTGSGTTNYLNFDGASGAFISAGAG